MEIEYTALFIIDSFKLEAAFPQVHPNRYYHHITLAFHPEDLSSLSEIGKIHKVQVTGRVTTDKVDALLVEVPFSDNKYPHITLSTAVGIKPFESNNEIEIAINENRVEKSLPITSIKAIEGYFDGSKAVTETESNM